MAQYRESAGGDMFPIVFPKFSGKRVELTCLQNGLFFTESRLMIVQILGKNHGIGRMAEMVPKIGNP